MGASRQCDHRRVARWDAERNLFTRSRAFPLKKGLDVLIGLRQLTVECLGGCLHVRQIETHDLRGILRVHVELLEPPKERLADVSNRSPFVGDRWHQIGQRSHVARRQAGGPIAG